MKDFDAIVVGAGHNGLISAAYLAQAGYHVAVFERRSSVGGAASSEVVVPGYTFDLGGSTHVLLRLTPIVQELQLGSHGLDYIELDPMFYIPVNDGLYIYRDVEKTADHIDSRFPGEGAAYRRFIHDWKPFARAFRDMLLSAPGPLDLGKTFMRARAMDGKWRRALPLILKPYGEVLDEYFQSEPLKAALVWLASQSGPAPTQSASGPLVLWHPLYHEAGIARPRGGAGALTQALARHIQSYGGQIHTGQPVHRIVVRKNRVIGVTAAAETYTARSVISAVHAIDVFTRLLPEDQQPYAAKSMRTGNGFGAALRLALDAPVTYPNADSQTSRTGLQLLVRDRAQINAAYGDYLKGQPATDPPLLGMTFSAVDDSLAPPGGEVLWIWAQYYPYQLNTGSWDEIGERVGKSILDQFEQYAPGTREKVIGSLFQHPLWLERELGLHRGNIMHLEMTIDQMFMMRPFLGMSDYRTHLKGLYLTGASTHPGGGVIGASGRNTALIVLKDLDRKRV